MRFRFASCLLVGLAALASPGCFQVSANGKFVLYVIDADTVGKLELYKREFKSDAVVKVNGDMIDDGDVEDFRIDRKSRLVAYTADQDTDGLVELYSADLKGSEVKKRNPALEMGDEISWYEFDAKSRYLLQLVEIGGTSTIWAADLKAKIDSKFQVGPTPVVGGTVDSFFCEPRGHFLLCFGDLDTDEIFELYRIDLKTFETETVNVELTGDNDVDQHGTDSKGRYGVYLAGADVMELHAKDFKTGEDTVLNVPLDKGETVLRFDIDPKGRRVVYEMGPAPIVDGAPASVLHATDLKTGAHVQLSGDLVPGGEIEAFGFDTKGKFLVYVADEDVNDVFELYQADLVHGGSKKLHPDLLPSADVQDFRIDPKGRFIAFTGDLDTDGVIELFVEDLASGEITKVHPDFATGGGIFDFQFDPKGRVLVWSGSPDEATPLAIFAFDLKHGADLGPISGDVVAKGFVGIFQIDPTGRRVVFAGTKDDPNVAEFYAVDLKTLAIEKLNAPYVDGGGGPF